MIKVFATEMAYESCDHAMQTLGALGMTLELPAQRALAESAADADVRGTERGPPPVDRASRARAAGIARGLRRTHLRQEAVDLSGEIL